MDDEAPHALDPTTLLDCCRCARVFNEEYGLPVGKGEGDQEHHRIIGKNSRKFAMPQNGRTGMELTGILYLTISLAQEASLESVRSAAVSLKHASNMQRNYGT